MRATSPWIVGAMVLIGLAFAGAEGSDDIGYGPKATFSGVYFSNFESSKFYDCRTAADCDRWANHEGEWVNCEPRGCTELADFARQAHVSLRSGTGELFNIVFIGRRSRAPTAKRFLNDTASKILLEKVVSLKKLDSK